MDEFIAALAHEDESIRIGCALTLIEIGLPMVQPLIAALRHPDATIRRSVAGILGQIKDARAVEPLAAALYDTDGNVRRSAAYALHKIGTPEALAAVAQWRAEQQNNPPS